MCPESLALLSRSHGPTIAALVAFTTHRGQEMRERTSFFSITDEQLQLADTGDAHRKANAVVL